MVAVIARTSSSCTRAQDLKSPSMSCSPHIAALTHLLSHHFFAAFLTHTAFQNMLHIIALFRRAFDNNRIQTLWIQPLFAICCDLTLFVAFNWCFSDCIQFLSGRFDESFDSRLILFYQNLIMGAGSYFQYFKLFYLFSKGMYDIILGWCIYHSFMPIVSHFLGSLWNPLLFCR